MTLIGTQLKELRERETLTMGFVSDKTGIKMENLYDIEHNRIKPSISLIKRLARLYGYDPYVLRLIVNKSELSEFQDEVGEWGNETFKHDDFSLYSLWHHLEKEVKELAQAIADFKVPALNNIERLPEKPKQLDRTRINDELADCFILLLDMAHVINTDILDEARKKLEINRQRTWGEPDEHGVIEHVEVRD